MKGCGYDPVGAMKRMEKDAETNPSLRARVKQIKENSKKKNPPPVNDIPININNVIPESSGGGIRKKRKSKKKYYSSSSDSDSDFRPKRRTNNSALQQLLVANRDAEEKELKKSQLMLNRHMVEEMKAIRDARPLDQRNLQKATPYPVGGRGIKKLIGTKKGNRARGDIVAEVMKKEGLSLSQASKYVKEHNLY